MKKLVSSLITIAGILSMFVVTVFPVLAQGDLVIDPNYADPRCADQAFAQMHRDICPINLDPIVFPFFVNFDFIENFSIFSYIALAMNIVFFGVGMMWVGLVLKAGIDYVNSQGDEGKIGASAEKIKSVLASISILFLSIALIVLVGSFLGLGNFFSWPKKFSQCRDGTFYIVKALELEQTNNTGVPVSENRIDAACF